MAYCMMCGKQIPDVAKFCPSCGAVTADNQTGFPQQIQPTAQQYEYHRTTKLNNNGEDKFPVGALAFSLLSLTIYVVSVLLPTQSVSNSLLSGSILLSLRSIAFFFVIIGLILGIIQRKKSGQIITGVCFLVYSVIDLIYYVGVLKVFSDTTYTYVKQSDLSIIKLIGLCLYLSEVSYYILTGFHYILRGRKIGKAVKNVFSITLISIFALVGTLLVITQSFDDELLNNVLSMAIDITTCVSVLLFNPVKHKTDELISD